MSEDLKINRGVELMLRRDKKEPKSKGLKIRKSISLLDKTFTFKIEFTWERA